MSDTAPTGDQTTTTDAPQTDTDGADKPLGEGGIKALAAERDARRAAEKQLADLQKQIEDGKKTAEQNANDELAQVRRESESNALRAMQYEIAAEKGLNLKLAARLTGATREELEQDADVLKDLMPGRKGPVIPNPGKTPEKTDGDASKQSKRDWLASMRDRD